MATLHEIISKCLEPRRPRRAALEDFIPRLEEMREQMPPLEEMREQMSAEVPPHDEAATPRQPPPQFLCPITQDLMDDPVNAADGNVYERAAIERWLLSHDTSPLTNARLPHKELTPAISLRQLIREFTGSG